MEKNQAGLLIVDMQEGFLDPSTKSFVQKVQDYVDEYGLRYHNIVATRFVNPNPSKWRDLLDWDGCGEGSKDLPIKLQLPSHTQIIDKPSHGLIKVENVGELFKNLERVDVLGVDTDACVLSCALDLFDMNITAQVLSDLCYSTHGEYYHYMALEILRRNLGQEQIRSSHTVWKDKT